MMTIGYDYGSGLYVNLTNRCDCACVFCLRHNGNKGSIYADNLWLEREPSREEALADLLAHDFSKYDELVFCGFGEPTFRIDDVYWLCDRLHEQVKTLPPIRINTNGHGSLIQKRDIVPEMVGRIDSVSVSLNGSTASEYCAVTQPKDGEAAWQAMLDFVRESAKVVPNVILTVVDKDKTEEELTACRELAESLGAKLRVRAYIEN
ncbi:MAG: TatD family nuclease-associated radical SAM protein [Evtepia sp.]